MHVLADYDCTGSSLAHLKNPLDRKIMTPEVISCVETEKIMKPSLYLTELQDRLLLDGVVHPLDLPSKSTISKCIRDHLFMSKKKKTAVPEETQRDENIQFRNEFLDVISDLDSSTIHCFDESSVVKTTCNRKYGNAPRVEPACEI